MSALSELLHTLIDRAPFHSQAEQEHAHDLATQVDAPASAPTEEDSE